MFKLRHLTVRIGIIAFLLATCFSGWAFTNLGNNVYQTDGSAADVQAAINASSNGGTVMIPTGSFTWSSSINMNKYVKVQGAGAGGFLGHSDSSVAVGTGSKTFTISVTNVIPFAVGQTVQALFMNTYNGIEEMTGTVTSWNGSTLVLNVTSSTGSGTYAMWVFSTPATTTIINKCGSPLVNMSAQSAGSPELSGIKFTYTGSALDHVYISQASGKPALVHDCWFSRPGSSSGRSVYFADNKGIVYRCSFDTGFYCNEVNGAGNLDEAWVAKCPGLTSSWTSNSTMGMDDTDGMHNIYIEDCYLAGLFLQASDPDDNSRTVVRHCVYDNSEGSSHGADTSAYGLRHFEFYNNTYIFNNAGANTMNVNTWFLIRGGTGCVFSNTMPSISSMQWGAKQAILITVEQPWRSQGPYGCWNTYPVPRQIGQSYNNGSTVTDPMYFWANTGNGNNPTPIPYSGDNMCSGTSGLNISTYLQSGRDYIQNTPKPGYTPYTYPHPLRTELRALTNAPSITSQPRGQSAVTNTALALTVGASGSGTLAYQWYSGSAISGATSASYSATSATATTNSYYVIVTNAYGSVTSSVATLTWTNSVPNTSPPSIATQPTSQTGLTNTALTLTVSASGNGLGYQWRLSESVISGATTSSYSMTSSTAVTNFYSVVVTNVYGSVTSSVATLAWTNGAGGSAGHYYSTTFPLTGNPMSEGGAWIQGGTVGLDWANIRTSPGLAYSAANLPSTYGDPTAVLTGTWGPDQTASAVVNLASRPSGGQAEVELRLRSSVSAHSCTGYEFLYSVYGDYAQIVRWNGAAGNFTILDGRAPAHGALQTGDVLKATAVGNVLSIYMNNALIFSVTDSTFSSGSPGIGFYPNNSSGGLQWGFSSFTATDGSGGSPNQPPVAIASVTSTNGMSPLAVNFSSAGSRDPEGAALTYNWAFGDGGTSTATNPTHTYQADGVFAAQLTVSDGTNTTRSSILSITIRPPSPSGLHVVKGP
jgi:hypothetical protein